MTEIKEYQKFTRTTAVYPEANTGSMEEIKYLTLGLAGEAGEVANLIKKSVRRGDDFLLVHGKDKLMDELGDVAYYLIRMADAIGVEFGEVLFQNQEKLNRRKAEGTLKR